MNALPARRIAHRVGRRSLTHLAKRRRPRLDLGMLEQRPERSRPLTVLHAVEALNGLTRA